ncbi:MAG: MarR family transcriptional regulator [Acidimicrobiia bacterium]
MQQMPKRWLNEKEQKFWRAYIESSIRLNKVLNADLEKTAGFDLLTYEIMVRLSEAPNMSLRMKDLAQNVSAQKSKLTYRVSQLERKGWVERCAFEEDKRGQLCRLTKKGFSILEKAAPKHVDAVLKQFIEPTEDEDIEQLTEMFHLIAASGPQDQQNDD